MVLNRAYEKDGQRHYVIEIRAHELNMLKWKKRDGLAQVALKTPKDV